MTNVVGMKMRAKPFKVLCDLTAPGHNKIIMPGHDYYKVTSGKAQGTFHGPRCYQTALKQYEEAEKQEAIKKQASNA